MTDPDTLRSFHVRGLAYGAYVSTGTPGERERWAASRARAALTPGQRALVAGFPRRMPVLVLSGTWCGDCVQQCPLLVAIAEANPERIDLRFLDRDENADLAERVKICGGLRVPTVIFMNEDHEFVHLLGDRVLSRYRAMAARTLGAACPLPGAALPLDEAAAAMQDWVDEFERVALLLRLSPKLRERYGD